MEDKTKELEKENEMLQKRVEELENKIENIQIRNTRVEGDKAWETSLIRILLIICFTYIFATLYLYVADTTNPFLGAIVPCAGFFLSTLTIKPIKKFYLKKRSEKLKQDK